MPAQNVGHRRENATCGCMERQAFEDGWGRGDQLVPAARYTTVRSRGPFGVPYNVTLMDGAASARDIANGISRPPARPS